MPDKGKDFGADLYELWLAGRENLPTVAREYAKANGYVAATDATAELAFRRSERLSGSTHGPVYSNWLELRNRLQHTLAATAANLALTGQALCLAASLYAATDAEAAAEMRRLIAYNGHPAPVDVPIVVFPDGG